MLSLRKQQYPDVERRLSGHPLSISISINNQTLELEGYKYNAKCALKHYNETPWGHA